MTSGLQLSKSERLLHLSTTTIPDLTDKIVRPDGQYCAAGGFGDVFRCRYTGDDDVKEVAVKAFRFSFSVDENKHGEEKAARMIRRELGIWRRLNHRNIVPFLGIAYGFGRLGSASLVSIWMPHGTLHTFLEAYDVRLSIAHRLQLLLGIANGLQYLHSFPVVHGDLTSNNVLLDHSYNACLTDFGCASLVGELPQGLTYLNMSTVRPGTLRWAAPEHFSLSEEQMKHTIQSDIYSLGNMALFVISGKYPWSEVRLDAAVVWRLSQGLKPARPLARPIDDRHWELINQCWSSIPERPLAEDVVSSLQQLLSTAKVPGTIGLAAVVGSQGDDFEEDFVGDTTLTFAARDSTYSTPLVVAQDNNDGLATPQNLSMPYSLYDHPADTRASIVQATQDITSFTVSMPNQFVSPNQSIAASSSSTSVGSAITPSNPSPGAVRGPETYTYKAKALYAYSASLDDPNEISFVKGDILDILDRQGKWWEAKKTDGTTGIAPSNYLQIISGSNQGITTSASPIDSGAANLSAGNVPTAPSHSPNVVQDQESYVYKAKALYAYSASPDDPNEISFLKGEVLDILDKQGKWWHAMKTDGTIGIAPSNYLQIL